MIRTLVVDDSKFMRTLIADMLVSDPKIDVIATAKDEEDAVAKARLHHPDMITLDVEMPRMDGLEALRAIMDDELADQEGYEILGYLEDVTAEELVRDMKDLHRALR